MAWSVPLSFRPRRARLSRRRRVSSYRLTAARTADPGRGPSPLTIRRYAGCLVIEVGEEIGPAAEPHLGRLLHGAIRPGATAVLVDLRHTAGLGTSGLSVLRLAHALASRHGLAFSLVGDTPLVPAPSGAGQPPTDRTAAHGVTGSRPPLDAGASALPTPR